MNHIQPNPATNVHCSEKWKPPLSILGFDPGAAGGISKEAGPPFYGYGRTVPCLSGTVQLQNRIVFVEIFSRQELPLHTSGFENHLYAGCCV